MHDIHKIALDAALTQMTAKKGIKRQGERLISVMYKDYTQIEDMKVMRALNLYRLTKSPKRGAICAINLIKEKICWKLKGRKCAY